MKLSVAAIASVVFTCAPLLRTGHAQSGSSGIVISQLYGGGGNAGATLRNDFIELFNRGNAPVNVSGWSVQYASASGSSSAPSGASVVDLVGYGAANAAEGSPAAELSNTTAAIRRSGGCTDTDNKRADFTVGSPAPRNTRSPLSPCGAAVPAPQIAAGGVVNAASFSSGSVAPGEILTIFGSGLGPTGPATLQLTPDGQRVTTSLAGTRILFGGVAAAMIYTSANQTSAVVPYVVGGRSTTEVVVEFEGRASNKVTLPVAPSAPGVFTLSSSGVGQGAILNQDYTVNGASRPATKGSVVIVYATGGGQTIPPSEDCRVISQLATLALPVSVRIGGSEAEVLYAGAAPGLVSGVVQINAKIPDGAEAGLAVPVTVTVGAAASQAGVTLAIGTPASGQDGTGPLIEERLQQLKHDPGVPVLPEIPHDRIGVPQDWLALISWNTQVGGTSTSAGATRPPMVQAALAAMFGGTYQILAAQEIPNAESADLLRTLLPGGATAWQGSFFDTTDGMDNGLWHRPGVTLRDAFALFVADQKDLDGRLILDTNRTTHPPTVGQFEAGDFDFTLINVHLVFADGDTSQSAKELRHVLDYLDWYFNQPQHDPDVIVCGDFNIPSALSGQMGRNGITLDSVFEGDPRFQSGERRFVVTVHTSTSRGSVGTGGLPSSNYDHCVLSADTMEEFIQARRVATGILTDHPEDPEVRLTSDHFPVVAFFKTRGEGVVRDDRRTIRPSAAMRLGVE